MNNSPWLGIDIAKKTFHAAIACADARPDQWASMPESSFEHSRQGIKRLLVWLEKMGCRPEDLGGVCLEATGRYSTQWTDWVGEDLSPIAVVNPARPKAYAKSLGIQDKSDRVDACVLALFGQATQPRPTRQQTQTQRTLRELSRTHQTLSADCRAYQQRVQESPICAEARKSIKRVIASLKRQIARLDEEIKRLIAQDPLMDQDFKRAQTIPGIGPKTAAIILAEFGDLRQYARNEIVALTGLYPREHTSGHSVRKRPRLAKAGKSGVRAHLYMGAMNACRHDPLMRAFAERLLANGKTPMQMLGAVMRKLLLLVRAVIVSGNDYDPNYLHAL